MGARNLGEECQSVNLGSAGSLTHQIYDDDAAIGVGLVFVSGPRRLRALQRELELRLRTLLRALAFLALPNLLDDEGRKHLACLSLRI